MMTRLRELFPQSTSQETLVEILKQNSLHNNKKIVFHITRRIMIDIFQVHVLLFVIRYYYLFEKILPSIAAEPHRF
jgi:hypothetical protein